MGSLKPGATYIYERVEDTVYAREMGADPSTRFVVGYNYPSSGLDKRHFESREEMQEYQLWQDIKTAARTNTALQKALEQVKILYYLSKEDAEH